jgi:hypothetical protein
MEKFLKKFTQGIIVALSVLVISCEKGDNDQVKVTYLIKEIGQEFEVSYINENGQTITESVSDTISSLWTYTFFTNKGDIIYMHSWFGEQVDPTKFQFRILLDGTIFRDAYNYDKDWGTTGKQQYSITRQGTVPFE